MSRRQYVEKMAKERAEKKAMQKAMANNVVIWFPLIFIIFIMMLMGAAMEIVMLLLPVALVTGTIAAIATWKSAYDKCYKKYLTEFSVPAGEDENAISC